MVDWLVFTQLALTRVEALTLASALLEEGFLRTIGLKSAEALRTAGLGEQFMDDSTALYSFVSLSSCEAGRSSSGSGPAAKPACEIPGRQLEEERQREGRDFAFGCGNERKSDEKRIPAETGERCSRAGRLSVFYSRVSSLELLVRNICW